MDAASSASVVQIVCDTAIQWDCKLPALFEQIEQARFIHNVVTPITFLVCIVVLFFVPLFFIKSNGEKDEQKHGNNHL